MRAWLIVAGLSLIAITGLCTPAASVASDKSGKYVTGGGVGSLQCLEFANDMEEARRAGGLGSPAGTTIVNVWAEYVLGFQTGYNYAAPRVRDIFAPLGASPSYAVLKKIEPWCEKHPLELFSAALVHFVETIQPKPEPAR